MNRTAGCGAVLAVALPCLLVVAGFLGAVWFHREALRASVTQKIQLETWTLPSLATGSARSHTPGRLDFAFFGDSLTICGPATYLVPMVQRELAAMGISTNLLPAVHPGLRLLNFAYLLDDVVPASPAAAVVEINLRLVGKPDDDTQQSSFPNLSRRLSPARTLRLREPLAAEGISLADPWVYWIQERLDLLYAFDGVRELGRSGLAVLAASPIEWIGRWRDPSFDAARGEADRRRSIYMEGMGREVERYRDTEGTRVSATVLRELRDELRRAGTRVVFYVSPVNPAVLKVAAEAGIDPERLVESVRRASGATDEEWLDLHVALPVSSFRDAKNHMNEAGCAAVAKALAERVRTATSGGAGSPSGRD